MASCIHFRRWNRSPLFRLSLLLLLVISSAALNAAAFGQADAEENERFEPQVDEKASQVIADYVEAMGGAMTTLAVETIKIEGEYGTEGSMNKFVFETDNEGNYKLEYSGTNRVVGNENAQWNLTTDGDASLNSGVLYPETFPVVTIVNRWEDMEYAIEYVGEDSIGENKVHVLLFSAPGRKPIKRCFDKESGLMTAQHVNGFYQEFTYAEVEDLTLISGQTLFNSEGNVHQIIKYDTTELHAEIDRESFAVPEGIAEEIKQKRKERLVEGLIEMTEGTLKIGRGAR